MIENSAPLWRCRACNTINDFEGQELALNDSEECDCGTTYRECPEGHFAMLGIYKCSGCGFSIEPEAMWFITPYGEEPVFIESGFEPVKRNIV